MIEYSTDLFGIWTLLHWHGSSAFRAFLPSLASTSLLVLFQTAFATSEGADAIRQPYTVTVFVSFFSFLLAFRLNYSYQRYWEAATHVYQMQSSLIDSAVALASFHYQCEHYKESRPLSFGHHEKLKNVTRERERLRVQTQSGIESLLEQRSSGVKENQNCSGSDNALHQKGLRERILRRFKYPFSKTKGDQSQSNQSDRPGTPLTNIYQTTKSFQPNAYRQHVGRTFSAPEQRHRVPSERDARKKSPGLEWRTSFASSKNKGGKRKLCELAGLDSPTPSLFLQEAAHLYSLLSAVAFSTLRYDLEGAQSPLAQHVPGRPFPPVNPDELHRDIKYRYYEVSPLWTCIYFFLGIRRGPAQRTMYNAARPFRVIGGVSDSECEMLMKAKGPYAQTALCLMWLKEFISREHLNGSTGDVAPPIVGRIFQFISQGVASYNQSRKIAYVPFPFCHSQMIVFFSLVIIVICPMLYFSFVNHFPLACVMNFTTVLCFLGSHEVARELENPYFTVPNDLPLNNYQAQFNEALIAGMFAGFNPDAWRIDEGENVISKNHGSKAQGEQKEDEASDLNPRLERTNSI